MGRLRRARCKAGDRARRSAHIERETLCRLTRLRMDDGRKAFYCVVCTGWTLFSICLDRNDFSPQKQYQRKPFDDISLIIDSPTNNILSKQSDFPSRLMSVSE
jgi:hypothetical protein